MLIPGEPRVPTLTRGRLPGGAARTIALRAGLWATAQAGFTAVLALASPQDAAWRLPAGLALGLVAAHPRAPMRALGAGFAVAVLSWTATRAGAPAGILVGGAVAGLAAAWLAAPLDFARGLQGLLAGASGAGAGAWLASLLPTAALPDAAQAAIGAALVGLGAAQSLWVASLLWTRTDQPPSVAWINATLTEPYRPPPLRARDLDRAMGAPDPETRDGLSEVAAWVYRLSWTLQALDRELLEVAPEPLDARIAAARSAAERATDPATASPLTATVRHLEQLARHREALVLERARTTALVDYALAFLEQARAGLALASVRPNETTPERLDDVLTRLRSRATEGDARRNTARQLTPLA